MTSPHTSAPVALRKPAHLVAPRARYSWLAGAVLRCLVVAAIALGAIRIWDDLRIPGWAWLGYIALCVGYCVAMPLTRYAIHRWEVTDDAIYTRTGFLSIELVIVPFSRVQTVELARGPLDRLLRLATIQVKTASTFTAVVIRGLGYDDASALVADLTRKTAAAPGDAT